ncbi:hypothetical protein CCM_03792 [Cordyceps militaris CM01]|uniref:Uncharacterized protein n=1 Tax=Cordyceps militaris (strain CM01) TaxID=983644 RepID=G3JGK2_CORMM|nr:uncharacterized protein CCM_03792 [Cordyceps militaris CM01]EGX92419.1 hypothetical protein CCM_03792 [Cordyceps militaris CM01]
METRYNPNNCLGLFLLKYWRLWVGQWLAAPKTLEQTSQKVILRFRNISGLEGRCTTQIESPSGDLGPPARQPCVAYFLLHMLDYLSFGLTLTTWLFTRVNFPPMVITGLMQEIHLQPRKARHSANKCLNRCMLLQRRGGCRLAKSRLDTYYGKNCKAPPNLGGVGESPK